MLIRIRPKPQTASSVIQLTPSPVTIQHRPMRVLDFDCEARPLHWIANDYVSKEITAMAWAWCDQPDVVSCYLLGESDPVEMLTAFVEAYNHADMVTGHYITGFDLPLVNGALTEYGLPPLGDKLVSDTKVHLLRRHGLSSSQENLAAMARLEHGKVKMDQQKWRAANRLTPEGLTLVRERVVGDVQQHIELRAWLLERDYLGPALTWKSGSAKAPEYAP